MVMERTERLEKEKSALSQDLQDKRETKEFESLEEEIRKEQEVNAVLFGSKNNNS